MEPTGEERLEAGVETILALPVSSVQSHEELLVRAIQTASGSDLPKRLRVRAALRLAKIFALPDRGASRAEVLEFEVMLWPLRNVFLQDPVVSFDLSEVCRTALNLEKIADFICSKLSEATQGDFPEQMWFVMLDLAAWHADRGEEAEVRRLWHLAHSAPKRMQDPRVLSHFYGWRFDNEPGPPEETELCPHLALPAIMRPLLGPERHCPCCLRPADCKVSQTCMARNEHNLIPGSSEALSEKAAFDTEVRKVLEQKFNLEGRFAQLDAEGDSPVTWQQAAAKEAKDIVWSRRFKVRIVDAPGTTDGVAAEAQHRQNRAEESRLKARGLATGSEFSSTQSSEPSHTSAHEAESSDDNSDLYFQRQEDEDSSQPLEPSPCSEVGPGFPMLQIGEA